MAYRGLYRTDGGVVVWACTDCGGAVWDRGVHDGWHATQETESSTTTT